MNEILKTKKTRSLLKESIEYFGKEKQILKTIEELSELIRALSRYLVEDYEVLLDYEQTINNRDEEMADCYIMLEQLEMIFQNKTSIKNHIQEKLELLEYKINQ